MRMERVERGVQTVAKARLTVSRLCTKAHSAKLNVKHRANKTNVKCDGSRYMRYIRALGWLLPSIFLPSLSQSHFASRWEMTSVCVFLSWGQWRDQDLAKKVPLCSFDIIKRISKMKMSLTGPGWVRRWLIPAVSRLYIDILTYIYNRIYIFIYV